MNGDFPIGLEKDFGKIGIEAKLFSAGFYLLSEKNSRELVGTYILKSYPLNDLRTDCICFSGKNPIMLEGLALLGKEYSISIKLTAGLTSPCPPALPES